MDWEGIKELSQEEFRRLTGVRRDTFDEMVNLLGSASKLLITHFYRIQID